MTGRDHRPLYARLLRLRHITPSSVLCFVFLEGAAALGALLALAELVSWWGVIVLPLTVAIMVKLNDVIAGFLPRPSAPVAARAPVRRSSAVLIGEEATTRLPVTEGGTTRPWAERLEAQQQWARQSATRHYE
jgi:hypothetical protein